MNATVLSLDQAQRRFITGPVAVNIASRSARGVPSIARAYGCHVSADGDRITLYLPAARASALLADVRGGAPVAAVFTRPATHETLQLKGRRADIVPVDAVGRERMRAYARLFREELVAFGLEPRFLDGMLAPVELEAVALGFNPVAAFDQTPGPDAGRPLSGRA